jgi:hypothetical protein
MGDGHKEFLDRADFIGPPLFIISGNLDLLTRENCRSVQCIVHEYLSCAINTCAINNKYELTVAEQIGEKSEYGGLALAL